MPQTTIEAMIASKQQIAATPEAQKTERFMLVLKTADRDALRDLCDKLDVKQIGFASELFTIALHDAIKSAAAIKPSVPAALKN